METIESFKVNHINLLPGLYVSRKDFFDGSVITTFDLRVTAPNREPVMDQPAIHTIEHLGATFLRNKDGLKDRIVYFGPMGCRTGFYLIIAGDIKAEDIYDDIQKMFKYILMFEGEIPGATAEQCGNYKEQNLTMAKYYSKKYLDELEHKRFEYPQ